MITHDGRVSIQSARVLMSGLLDHLVPFLEQQGPVEASGSRLLSVDELAAALELAQAQGADPRRLQRLLELSQGHRRVQARGHRVRAWLLWGSAPWQDEGCLRACRCRGCGWLGRAGDLALLDTPTHTPGRHPRCFVCPECRSPQVPEVDAVSIHADGESLRVYSLDGQLYTDDPRTLQIVPITDPEHHRAWREHEARWGPAPPAAIFSLQK